MLKNTLFYLDVNDPTKIRDKIELLEGRVSSNFDIKKLTHVVTNRLVKGVKYIVPTTKQILIVEENKSEEKPVTPSSPSKGRFHQAMLQKSSASSPTKTQTMSLEDRLKYRPSDSNNNTSPSKLQARALLTPLTKKKEESFGHTIQSKPVGDILLIASKHQLTILHFPDFAEWILPQVKEKLNMEKLNEKKLNTSTDTLSPKRFLTISTDSINSNINSNINSKSNTENERPTKKRKLTATIDDGEATAQKKFEKISKLINMQIIKNTAHVKDPYIVVEDTNNYYPALLKPFCLSFPEEKTIPKMHFHGVRSSPFIENPKPVQVEETFFRPVSNRFSGHCELCKVDYPDFSVHVVSPTHTQAESMELIPKAFAHVTARKITK